MVEEAALTVAALLADAGRRFAAAGIPDPRREALRLWSGINHEHPGAAFLGARRPVTRSEADAFEAAAARRAAGEPLAYVVECTGFRTLTLRTDRRALIPRPETEGLVELALGRAPAGRVADIGTGTGCIALSLRAEGAYSSVIAVDRSAAALELAAENARHCELDISVIRGDLTASLADASLDALVSNPPYLTDEEYDQLDPSVRAWEPAPALASGADGMDATRRLLDDGRRVVRGGGWIALEIDVRRAAAAAACAVDLGWTGVSVARDLFGRERYLLAQRSAES